jgi:SAM-dependent methyltransferase
MTERDRLRKVYADREDRLLGNPHDSRLDAARRFMVQRRQRVMLKLLAREGLLPLGDKDVLEVGCGDGNVLRELQSLGAAAPRLHGVELLDHRLEQAMDRGPRMQWIHADAQHLPYPDDRFDLVLQFTVFTSILDDGVRQSVAAEMLRVLRPGGRILWYDFWLNPTNRQTRGIGAAEIRRLFPGCGHKLQRVTLAPPIARRLVRCSPRACSLLESARFLCSHYFVVISPGPTGSSGW